jgi:eukaryotic-like serine/threonine-protein kinase
MPDLPQGDVAEIVKSAFERDPKEWPHFLEVACNGNKELRAEVESLLHFGERSPRFIDEPAVHLAAGLLVEDETLRPGERLGQYEVYSVIGSGGMGEVYLAEDTALGRKVALKLLKPGLGNASIVRHFRREERILAGLNHPNIARLYGTGITPQSQPYFIMEYVEGERLDEFCEARDLTIKERLDLFRKICSAVTYAHQRLVIHRDLKPANIRVTPEGEPKLLDFGIAKLADTENTQGATITLQAVMTPEYASPEQVVGESITTASDVYSLGVVLYRLLTGRSPYRTTTNRPEEIARAITEQEPTRPSTAISKGDENSRSRTLQAKLLRGDLDNIILMAMRKEPSRRYQSVAQFSADIQRHLEGRPVFARKDTFAYRTSKFIKRHPFRVAGAALILLSLVGGMMTTAWQAKVARREEAKANHERTKAEDVKNALVRMLNYSSSPFEAPRNSGGKSVKEILDEAAKRIENGEFADQPELKAELEEIIGTCYYAEGNYALAKKWTQEYLDLHQKLYGEDIVASLPALEHLAAWFFFQGNLRESERYYRRLLPLMRDENRKGKVTAETVGALNMFGYLRRTQGDSREAELVFRESLEFREEVRKNSSGVLEPTRSTLASTLADQGKFDEALRTARDAVAEYRQLGEVDTANFAFALTVLGGFLVEKGEYAEGDAILGQAETIDRKLLPPSSLWLGDNLRNQAISLYQQARYAESLDKSAETLGVYRERLGAHYDNYPTALITQGLSLAKTGRVTEGEQILREAAKIREELLPKEHFWVALANSALGECLTIQQRYEEAEPLLAESYKSLKNSQGPNNPRTRLAEQRLVELYEKWQKPDLPDPYRAVP